MIEIHLYCPIEVYGMHGDNLTSALHMHTITSHSQLLACTQLPHTLSYSHAHHYLTPSAIHMHTITSHPVHLRPIPDQMFSFRHLRLQICTYPLYFLTKILPALCLIRVYISKFLYFFQSVQFTFYYDSQNYQQLCHCRLVLVIDVLYVYSETQFKFGTYR